VSVRIVISTPIDGTPNTGTVHAGYAAAREAVLHQCAIVLGHIPPKLMFSNDVVRARNRAARVAIASDMTHVLHWDSDVIPDNAPALLAAMLATGYDFVGAPFPTKSDPPRVAIAGHGQKIGERVGDCLPVAGFGFGFCLTSVPMLRVMRDRYDAYDWFYDVTSDGQTHRTVGLFDLRYSYEAPAGHDGPWRERLSEDLSFAHRALEMGIQPWLYVGEHANVAHVGQYAYRLAKGAL